MACTHSHSRVASESVNRRLQLKRRAVKLLEEVRQDIVQYAPVPEDGGSDIDKLGQATQRIINSIAATRNVFSLRMTWPLVSAMKKIK